MSASSCISSAQASIRDDRVVSEEPITQLPLELNERIFNSLSSPGCISHCSAMWEVKWLKFPPIGEMQWKKFVDLEKQGLRFEGLEFPNLKDLEAAAIDLARNVEGDRGVSIVVIPGGLSFAKLLTIAKKMSVRALFINDTVKPAISEIETERPYIALISNSVLNGSRRKTILELKALVQEKGYEVPLSIELLTLMVFHYKIHSKRLFSDAPWTCSLTSDRVGKRVVTVGGFSGPVDGSCHGFHINHYFGFGLEGIAPVRRF